MRVLLDECVPRALRYELPGHQVKTVAEAGWTGVKNGELLPLSAQQFDVLLTVDTNLQYQQNLANAPIAVMVVHARTNDIADLQPLMVRVLESIGRAKRGAVIKIQ
jgi:PIN like domain